MSDEAREIIIEKARRRCLKTGGFKWFVYNIFASSFDDFIGGEYIDSVCDKIEKYNWTMDVTGRDHFKSTRLYACVMFDIFTAEKNTEAHYFSYNIDMSRYHTAKIREMISINPFFMNFTNNSEHSASQIDYHNGLARITCTPQGLLSFKRGIHADRLYIDDPYKDPDNKLVPTLILKINKIIKTEIDAMANKGARVRVVGTSQTNQDIYFQDSLRDFYKIDIQDAMKDEAKQVALWPEWKDFVELMEIRDRIGEKEFNQEYRARPAYDEDSYISRQKLLKVIDVDLENHKLGAYTPKYDVVAGYDVGKHTHPAHFCIFERRFNKSLQTDEFTQIHSVWFNKMNYIEQVEYIKEACDKFKIDILQYDGTRGELEALAEQKKLPPVMKSVIFGVKSKNAMATAFNVAVERGTIRLFNEQRQMSQILAVNSNLQAMETQDGHGDSFWSIGLALTCDKKEEYRVRFI